jgi:glucose-1-phosphate cytidylyltransferase
MHTIVLCGGRGTRLREETEFKPKPMIEIGDRPILWHIMRHYRRYGVRDFTLCLGYKGELIRNFFLTYNNMIPDITVDLQTGGVRAHPGTDVALDWHVNLVDTGLETNTGSRIKAAIRYVQEDTVFVTYGDGVANVDITALLAHHRQHKRLATVTAVRPSSRFGELNIEGARVLRFREKPQVSEGWINGGFFVFERSAFERLDASRSDLSLEGDLLEPLAAEGQLTVYKHDQFWQCMDTYREMQLLNDLWRSGTAPWKTW